jgi:serine/threonine protein kinase/WD40 repeat protein
LKTYASGSPDVDSRDERLAAVLEEVTRRRNAGESLDDGAILAEHPDLLPELADSLSAMRRVEEARQRAREDQAGGGFGTAFDTVGAEPAIRVPGYDVLGEIHRGGQGVVYRAIQNSTARDVAIKVIHHGPFTGSHDKSRFNREVHVLAQLQHPNIVAIHDSGVVEGRYYFVMDYVRGQAFDDYVNGTNVPAVQNVAGAAKATTTRGQEAAMGAHDDARREQQPTQEPAGDSDTRHEKDGQRLSIGDTLRIFAKVCDAVAAAHVKGIIHRDLKPSNIIVCERGEPRILDFGLAKLSYDGVTDRTTWRTMTVTGQFVGSLPWASPEQAEGSPERIDLRSDVYSLGVMLYQLLTGEFPYPIAGRMRDVLQCIVDQEPMRPSRLRRGIDGELEAIVLKCLAKEPERRYETAGALARDLYRYLADEPIEAKRDSTLYVLRKKLRRHRIVLGAGLAFVVLLILSSAVAWTLYAQSQSNLWASYLAQAKAVRVTKRAGQRIDALNAVAKAAAIRPTFELRNEAIAAMALPDVRTLSEAMLPPGWSGVYFSPNLQYYVLSGQPYSAFSLRRMDGHIELMRTEDFGTSWSAPVFSLDGRWCAMATPLGCQVMDLSNNQVRLAIPLEPSAREVGDFSRDGNRYAFCANDGVRIIELSDDSSQLFPYSSNRHRRVRFAPDANRLASWSSVHNEVVIRDAHTGNVLLSLEHPTDEVWGLAWSPDGTLLATGCGDSRVYVHDTQTGSSRVVFTEADSAQTDMSFDRSGQILMSSGWDGAAHFWDIWSRTHLFDVAANCKVMTDDDRIGCSEARGSEGTLVSVRRFERSAYSEMRIGDTWTDKQPFICQVAVHPSGRWAALVGGDRLHVCDLETGAAPFSADVGQDRGAWISPQGDRLITSGRRGVYDWPIHEGPGELGIGPSRALLGDIAPGAQGSISASADGRMLAVAAERTRAAIIDLDQPGVPRWIGSQEMLYFVALNPDGSKLATSSWFTEGVKVWDVASGELSYELPIRAVARTFFTPDGRQLVTSTGSEEAIWDAQSGESVWHRAHGPGPGLLGPLSVSPDQRIFAFRDPRWVLHLLDYGTLEPLASIELPERTHTAIDGVAWTPAGLVAAPTFGRVMFHWDLRALREQLAAMNLDWDHPPYPPPNEPGTGVPLKVVIDLGELASKPAD